MASSRLRFRLRSGVCGSYCLTRTVAAITRLGHVTHPSVQFLLAQGGKALRSGSQPLCRGCPRYTLEGMRLRATFTSMLVLLMIVASCASSACAARCLRGTAMACAGEASAHARSMDGMSSECSVASGSSEVRLVNGTTRCGHPVCMQQPMLKANASLAVLHAMPLDPMQLSVPMVWPRAPGSTARATDLPPPRSKALVSLQSILRV